MTTTTIDDLELDVLEVLTGLFLLDGEVVFDNYVIKCPHPDHEDNDPSCQVRLTPKTDRHGRTINAGTWHCFACNARGDIFRLGAYVLNMKRSEVRKLLSPNNPEAAKAALQRKLVSLRSTVEPLLSREEWNRYWYERSWLEEDAREPDSYLDGPLTYLYERGFTPTICKKWGVRYVSSAEINTKKGVATIKKSIAIPINDDEHRVIAWCYRRTDDSPDWQPRYLYTHNSPRSEVWINGDRMRDYEEVVVCEGALDSMWVEQCGLPSVAVGGTGVDVYRARSLAEWNRVILFMDRDKAGKLATWQIGAAISEMTPTLVTRYPRRASGTDPQELDPKAVGKAVRKAIPWPAWALRLRLSGGIS